MLDQLVAVRLAVEWIDSPTYGSHGFERADFGSLGCRRIHDGFSHKGLQKGPTCHSTNQRSAHGPRSIHSALLFCAYLPLAAGGAGRAGRHGARPDRMVPDHSLPAPPQPPGQKLCEMGSSYSPVFWSTS